MGQDRDGAAAAGAERRVTVTGVGLHTGRHVGVTLIARSGATRIAVGGVEAAVTELTVVGTDRATTVEGPGGAFQLQTVEHAFAALGGLGIRQGVTLVADGPELPLLDGGALRWCEALTALGIDGESQPAAARLRVARAAVLEVGASRYELTPGDGVEVEAVFETDDARLGREARWRGDPQDFRRRIAPARTFAWASDVAELASRGLARHVDPAAVIVIAPDAIHCVAPFSCDEPARHKLLDLIGDSYLIGGPPVGRLRAVRPGHRANAQAFATAIAEGVLVRA